jgi:hypothetical protein
MVAAVLQLGIMGRCLASGLLPLKAPILFQGGFLSFLAGLTAHQYATAQK